MVNNNISNLIVQWGVIWSNATSNDYINGTVNLQTAFSGSSSYIIVGTAMDLGDFIQFKNLTATTAPYTIFDRLLNTTCYNHAFWLAIGT